MLVPKDDDDDAVERVVTLVLLLAVPPRIRSVSCCFLLLLFKDGELGALLLLLSLWFRCIAMVRMALSFDPPFLNSTNENKKNEIKRLSPHHTLLH